VAVEADFLVVSELVTDLIFVGHGFAAQWHLQLPPSDVLVPHDNSETITLITLAGAKYVV
jgi:hypothetical protein